MVDKIEKIRRSLVQHGTFSNRVYLMKLHPEDMPGILQDIQDLVLARGYSKVFAKVPASHIVGFEQRGYRMEALVPRFFGGEEDGAFLCRYFTDERSVDTRADAQLQVLALAEGKWGQGLPVEAGAGPQVVALCPQDAAEMSRVYREVFPTYPFPIHDPDYLTSTMQENIAYYGVRQDGKIVAVASAEMDPEALNVEMTDFATLPEALGRGLALFLLHRMESDVEERGYLTAFTIARAVSAGMNVTFAKLSYIHAGTLVNNTNIGGQVESMNVWYKQLLARRP